MEGNNDVTFDLGELKHQIDCVLENGNMEHKIDLESDSEGKERIAYGKLNMLKFLNKKSVEEWTQFALDRFFNVAFEEPFTIVQINNDAEVKSDSEKREESIFSLEALKVQKEIMEKQNDTDSRIEDSGFVSSAKKSYVYSKSGLIDVCDGRSAEDWVECAIRRFGGALLEQPFLYAKSVDGFEIIELTDALKRSSFTDGDAFECQLLSFHEQKELAINGTSVQPGGKSTFLLDDLKQQLEIVRNNSQSKGGKSTFLLEELKHQLEIIRNDAQSRCKKDCFKSKRITRKRYMYAKPGLISIRGNKSAQEWVQYALHRFTDIFFAEPFMIEPLHDEVEISQHVEELKWPEFSENLGSQNEPTSSSNQQLVQTRNLDRCYSRGFLIAVRGKKSMEDWEAWIEDRFFIDRDSFQFEPVLLGPVSKFLRVLRRRDCTKRQVFASSRYVHNIDSMQNSADEYMQRIFDEMKEFDFPNFKKKRVGPVVAVRSTRREYEEIITTLSMFLNSTRNEFFETVFGSFEAQDAAHRKKREKTEAFQGSMRLVPGLRSTERSEDSEW